jgi:hypothetical protein
MTVKKIKVKDHAPDKIAESSKGAENSEKIVKTVVEQRSTKDVKSKWKDVYTHLNYAHERMDRHEELIKGIYNKVDRALDELRDMKAVTEGKDIEFEKALREAKDEVPELNKSQMEIYGNIAPEGIREIVVQVLGTDFGSYTRADSILPNTFFTVLVPKRLSGYDWDFRSCTISNSSAEADVKRWCERIKSNIHRTFSVKNAGTPKFLIV